ncbi:hypothetical protein [Hugenholtzia roseola]|uniref:hypothetical protein n=1 Tax=Hugenholtzia roseola TaxID=1002 RepID=UPI00040CEE6A|nr:hypothetical protein [Hugenholtzia roseola]
MKITGLLFLVVGFLVVFYKDAGFYGFGGYVSHAWENICLIFILFMLDFLFLKTKKYKKF